MEEVVTTISGLNTAWVLIAAFLVFFMQAGFALLESGFTQAKNAVNIIMKNMLDVSFGTLCFFIVGFGLMFGAGNGYIALEGGLFYGGGAHLLWVQFVGVIASGLFTFIASYLVLALIKAFVGLRASDKEQHDGLDLKHGQAAYPDFN